MRSSRPFYVRLPVFARVDASANVQYRQTKPEIAAAMSAELHAEGVPCDFVNLDALSGNSTLFRRAVDCLYQYAVFVHRDQTIYRIDPKPSVSERRAERGRSPHCEQANLALAVLCRHSGYTLPAFTA
jgi:SRSO17 transposase